jgi:methyl-accepting chemotaxis protein
MATREELGKAIGAHGLWKVRLRDAIAAGASEMTPAQIEADDLCVFGKWLHGLGEPDTQSEHYDTVHSLHKAFHKEAARVLRLALTGSRIEASQALEIGGAFAIASAALTRAMMNWRKSVEG